MATSTFPLIHGNATSSIPELPTDRLLGWLRPFQEDSLRVMWQAFHAKGDLVRLRVGPLSVVVASHPDHLHHLLVRNQANWEKKTRGYQLLRKLLGDGLLTSDGELWKRQRRTANPAFRRKVIAGFADTMVDATADHLQGWDRHAAAGAPVDVADELGRLTLRIAGETLFSQDISTDGHAVGGALGVVMHAFGRLAMSVNPLAAWLPTPANWRYHQALRTLDRVVRGIVDSRRSELSQGEDGPTDLLGLFMAARDPETGEGMPDRLLRDEVLTMLLAGHETTAGALTWALYLLARHPEVAERVFEEGQQVLGDRRPTAADSRALPLTRAVLLEGMRLFPPVWVTARVAREDDELSGHPIKAGTFVFASNAIVHRHPRYWSEPDAFRPERFLEANPTCPDGSPRPRTAFQPFASGSRKCIGEHFAMMEGILLLSLIVRRYRLALPHDGYAPEPLASVTLRPKHGLPLRLVRREG